jgi:hypothetical protein
MILKTNKLSGLLFGEFMKTFADRGMSRGQHDRSPTAVISVSLPEPDTFSFK